MKNLLLILTATLSILLSAGARAELKWEQIAIELHPAVSDKQAIAHFKYENTGTQPIRFKSVHASCGCTTAQTQKDVVPPKGKGEITATFNIGDRTGVQTKTVTVQTDDPDPAHSTTTLTLKAVIPQSLEIAPTFVFWQSGEEAKPKTITVKAGKDFAVKGIKVTSSSTLFQTKVEKGGTGEFKIIVTPQDTSKMVSGALTIQPEDSNKSFYANVRVMGPTPDPTAKPAATPAPSAATR
ncbi:MAG: DUF1573 domain-containing protein [Verrucomicrobiota bacterium]